jgi:hypothetical protein
MGVTLEPLLYALPICAFIVSIFALLMYLSGWRTLASHYRTNAPFTGKVWRFSSAKLGQTQFNRCLTIGSSSNGLYIAVTFPLSLGFAPLLIPWEVAAVSLKKFWFYEYWEFHIGDRPSPTIKVGKRLGQEIIQASMRA